MLARQPQSWADAESSDDEDNGGKAVLRQTTSRGRSLNWADSSDESEDSVDEDSDGDFDSTSSEDDVDEGNIGHSILMQQQHPSVLPSQVNIGGGPKPFEQMSKKERKALKEKELQDLNELLGEFGVTPGPPKPTETDGIKITPTSEGVEIANENSIVRDGALQRIKVRRKRKKESKLLVQENDTTQKDENVRGDAILDQPVNAVLKPKLITGRKKSTKVSPASSAAKAAIFVDTKKKKQDKKDKKKHYNQNPPNRN